MKKVLTLLSLTFFLSFAYGQDLSQDPEMKSEIEDLADLIGNKLMNCCSTWGAKVCLLPFIGVKTIMENIKLE